MDDELIRRAEDLMRRAEKTGSVTSTPFLTPAQVYELERWAPTAGAEIVFHGGHDGAERRVAFFLPDYMEPGDFDPWEQLRVLSVTVAFGSPGHRDYMGAVLGLGIKREWIGDIVLEDNKAWIFCLPSVAEHLCASLDKVGRYGVKTALAAPEQLPKWERKLRELTFSVKSPRLDAVAAGMFGMSRSSAAQAVAQGLVSLNYEICQKCDAQVEPGDVISLRGRGKGTVTELGGRSRRDRLFIKCGIYT